MFTGDDVHGVALIVNLKINPIITASTNATKDGAGVHAQVARQFLESWLILLTH